MQNRIYLIAFVIFNLGKYFQLLLLEVTIGGNEHM